MSERNVYFWGRSGIVGSGSIGILRPLNVFGSLFFQGVLEVEDFIGHQTDDKSKNNQDNDHIKIKRYFGESDQWNFDFKIFFAFFEIFDRYFGRFIIHCCNLFNEYKWPIEICQMIGFYIYL